MRQEVQYPHILFNVFVFVAYLDTYLLLLSLPARPGELNTKQSDNYTRPPTGFSYLYSLWPLCIKVKGTQDIQKTFL